MNLHNYRVLVTAAGQGLGRASALALAELGADVIATDINEAQLETLVTVNSTIKTHRLDVTDSMAIEALSKNIGTLDALFNCAGYVHSGTILDCTEEAWEFSFDLNVKSMYRMTRTFPPAMLERAKETGTASILNMASMASSIKGFPNRFAYGTTKAAVIGLTKAVAADYVRQGVRCNAICPGTVDTPSLRGRIAEATDPVQAERDFIARQPMGRLATVNDLTPMIVYLLSPESRFVTGQALLVDGGVTI